MKDDLWARVRELGSITWKGCDWVELLVVRTRRTGSGMTDKLLSISNLSVTFANIYMMLCKYLNTLKFITKKYVLYKIIEL